MTTATYPEDPASIAQARAFVASVLAGASEETRERAVLITSELATNAITHGHSGFTVTTTLDADEIRVTISDSGGAVPTPRRPDPSETHGRGLLIVSRLARDWGVDTQPGSTTVWFTLALSDQPVVAEAD